MIIAVEKNCNLHNVLNVKLRRDKKYVFSTTKTYQFLVTYHAYFHRP